MLHDSRAWEAQEGGDEVETTELWSVAVHQSRGHGEAQLRDVQTKWLV
jgi:hypothetical protein